MTSPYKKSIWCQDSRYKVDDIEFNDEEKRVLSRLMSVDAAKKNTPPVPIKGLLEISKLAKSLPKANEIKNDEIETFISSAKKIYGAGIPTIICMLSVETEGDYPPMDRKFCSGLLNKKIITEQEQKSLKGSSTKKIAKLYKEKVIPAWFDSLKGRTSEQADNYWGRGGIDG